MCWRYSPNLYLQKFHLNKHLLHTAVIYSHANFFFLCITSHISTRYGPDSNTFCYHKCNQASPKIIHWANALLAKLSCWCGEINKKKQKQPPPEKQTKKKHPNCCHLAFNVLHYILVSLLAGLKRCHLIQRVVLFCFVFFIIQDCTAIRSMCLKRHVTLRISSTQLYNFCFHSTIRT